ncbi:HAD-IIA family hydrolase [Nocardioides houyundeii]|uniref:HAD-IIA family hydrolase n=1 Tax=Nocardioides houyundeii TaxID=2045452 RepID=UPI001F0753B9|nr:HAD-IIA family hydrolase [Nocardioides houyundeii]
MLQESTGPLAAQHDLFMLDLDGVVYIEGAAVPGVPEEILRLREAGCHVAFVTNNAARPAAQVAERLTGLGVAATAEDVVTSAQAAASLLRTRFGPRARVLMLGGPGLEVALRAADLEPVQDVEDDEVVALVTGYGPDVLWRHIMRSAVRIRDGLPWVASNTDATIPTSYGLAPGHGTLVRTLAEFAGVQPVVAGKPSRPLLDETVTRVGGNRPIMVGDRLDTDIEGARVAGYPSLLVLTGVTGLSELVSAPESSRPTYIYPTLQGVFAPHPVPQHVSDGVELGGWHGQVDDAGTLVVAGAGSEADWWRVVAVAAWDHLDATGAPAGIEQLAPPARDGRADR